MISVVIPVVRDEKAKRCIDALRENSTLYEVITEVDRDGIGCPTMVKRLSDRAKYDWVLFLGDDTIPQPHMIDHAVDCIADGTMLIGLNDGRNDGNYLTTHWMAHKDILKLTGGEFFSTEYNHCFCDRELLDIAQENDCFVWAEKAKLVHDHPAITDAEDDEFYEKSYNEIRFMQDRSTYLRRKAERLNGGAVKLAIALPISEEKVHTQFFISFLGLDRPEDCHVIFPKTQFHMSDLGKIRTHLCEQAISLGCTHILFMDTDQVYHDTDLIPRLLAHGKDIVGGKVHRRYPPFEPILNVDRQHVDDGIIDRGGLVEVDATGTGCLLVRIDALNNIPKPWFEMSVNDDGKPIGEDIGFCYKAKGVGYRIYVDCDVEIGHLALIQVGDSLYQLWKKIKR